MDGSAATTRHNGALGFLLVALLVCSHFGYTSWSVSEVWEKCSKTRGYSWLSARWRVFVLREGEVLEKAGLYMVERGFRAGTSAMWRSLAREHGEASVPQVSTKPTSSV